jgi:gas vesicle protein
MMKRSKTVISAVGAVGAVVAGAAAGYAAGVLTAPASGKQTRRVLGRRIESKTDDLKHQARKTVKQARATVADAMSSAMRRTKLRAV